MGINSERDNYSERTSGTFLNFRTDWIPYVILLALGAALLYRSEYGFIWNDESLYFAMANRFLQGDLPIADDWHIAELYCILLMPWVWCWKHFSLMLASVLPSLSQSETGLDGIIAGTRIVYVVLQTAVSLFVYRQLRKKTNAWAALLAAAVFLLYCKNNNGTVSYYAVSSICLLTIVLLLARWNRIPDRRTAVQRGLLCGFLAYILLFSSPFLSVVLVYEAAAYFVMQRRDVIPAAHPDAAKKNDYTGTFIGTVVAAAVVLCLATFSGIVVKADPEKLLLGLNNIIHDPTHFTNINPVMKCARAFLSVGAKYKYTIVLSALSGAWLCLKRVRHAAIGSRAKHLLFLMNSVILCIDILAVPHTVYLAGSAVCAVAVWGWQIYFLTDGRDKRWFFLVYLPGILTAFVLYITSDTGFSGMMPGFVISAVCSFVFAGRLYSEFEEETHSDKAHRGSTGRRAVALLAVVICLLTMSCERFLLCFCDRPVYELSEKLTDGPAAGIRTTEELKKRYDTVSSVIGNLKGTEGRIYLMGFCPWGYLETDMRPGTFTCWRVFADLDEITGQEYYESHEDKFPDVILFLSSNYAEYDGYEDSEDHYPAEPIKDDEWYENWHQGYVLVRAEAENYREVDVPCGELFISGDAGYDALYQQMKECYDSEQ